MPTLQELMSRKQQATQATSTTTQGKTLDAFMQGVMPKNATPPQKQPNFGERLQERFTGAAERVTPKVVKAAESLEQGKAGKVKTAYRLAGNLLSGGAEVVFGTLLDAAVPDQIAKPVKKEAKKLIESPVGQKGLSLMKEYAEGVSDRYEQYKAENPEKSQDLEALVGFLELYPGAKVTGEIAGTATKGTREAAGMLSRTAAQTVDSATTLGKRVPEVDIVRGTTQKAKELAERLPRAVERGAESVQESAQVSKRIAESTPEIAQAIKSKLDDRVINAVETADEATKQAQKEMVKLADSTKKTLGIAKRPEYVAGEAAAKQYELLVKQKRAVGKEIEDATRAMSKTQKVDIVDEVAKMKKVLTDEGVRFTKTGLDFRGSNFTTSQRKAIKELFSLATEAGETLTPYQIYKKDQLFSQLSREARFDKIGNIFVTTPEGQKSIYSIFRDIFNTKLDTVSDEIRDINRRYGEIKRLTDDIEDTIAKTGKLDTAKNIDLAEVAQTRLRRLSSDAQSAAEYRAVVEKMDEAARRYGYTGANPATLSDFAIALRDIYPTAVPKTSATAILGKPTLTDLLEKALSAGAPDIRDQQKALKVLLGVE